jgi:nucleotide-binding universal stress UspA family protein
MKTIIVPTDFSAVSINAMNYALNMAKDLKARVIIFNAFQIPVAFSEVPVVTVSMEEMQHTSEEKLATLKKDVEHVTSGEIEINTVSRLGDVVEELADLCDAENPFAVVMGTKGAGKIERLLIGSNTLSAIKRLHAPVMIIPPGATYKKIKKIGFACDFTKVRETTPVNEITDLLNTFGATLDVLNVDYKEKHFSGDITTESTELHSLLAHLNPSYHYINSINVEEGINSFSDANNIDLLLTIPKKHTVIENIFAKSHSNALILHAHIPIVAIHE